MDTRALRKARGAFFTPCEITDFIASWAVRAPGDRVLEPSCGEAAFLLSAAARLGELGAPKDAAGERLRGVEIHEASTRSALARLREAGFDARLTTGDFFDLAPERGFDAVIGNPPYIRYQDFSGGDRAKSLQAALAQGVRLSGLASSWAAFTIHAAQHLNPGGRLGLVLPAELLTVKYAAEVRRFLLRRFGAVRLVVFDERVFPGVLEEVVLLLAEGEGGASRFEVFQARNLAALTEIGEALWSGFTPKGEDGKWTAALLPGAAFETYRALAEGEGFSRLLDWGETYLGAVTGANGFFALTGAEAAALRLPADERLPISPPGARHLRGLRFGEADWRRLAAAGKRCHLFAPRAKPSAAARRHVEAGERAGVHLGYKCRNRSPWWRAPLVARPDLFLTYMNHEGPRLVANDAGAHALNSVYGVRLREARRALGRELLPLASLNSLTLLGAEIVGRAYGGGLLKHEPKEADLLPLPAPAVVEAAAPALRAVAPEVEAALLAGERTAAVRAVDRVLLSGTLGLSSERIEALRAARDILFQRRVARGRSQRAAG